MIISIRHHYLNKWKYTLLCTSYYIHLYKYTFSFCEAIHINTPFRGRFSKYLKIFHVERILLQWSYVHKIHKYPEVFDEIPSTLRMSQKPEQNDIPTISKHDEIFIFAFSKTFSFQMRQVQFSDAYKLVPNRNRILI